MTTSKTRKGVHAVTCAALFITASIADAGTGDCSAPLAAINKLWQTPNHQYMTETAGYNGGKTTNGEMIATTEARYVMVSGKWHRSKVTKEQIAEQVAENAKTSLNDQCHYLRDESVDGESAAVYSTSHHTEDDTSETQLWISKKSGLPLRMEISMDVGGGAVGKSHQSVRISYSNVTAPAGVQ